MRAIETSADDRGLIAALAAEGLPTDDLAAEGRQFFSFYTDDGVLIGYGGVEALGNGAALLRSVTVAGPLRRQGHGRRVVAWLLDRLAAQGVEDVWMLTVTAAALGESCGFQAIDRATAPAFIRNTRQFAELCPSSAVLMRKKREGHGRD